MINDIKNYISVELTVSKMLGNKDYIKIYQGLIDYIEFLEEMEKIKALAKMEIEEAKREADCSI